MHSLNNRNIVILGAGGGFGRAVLERLAPHGANFAIADFSQDSLAGLEAKAKQEGADKVHAGTCDVCDEATVQQFFRSSAEALGALDILLYLPGLSVASPVTEMKVEDYDKIVDVNLKGLFLAAKHFVPHTEKERQPLLSFISSQAATRANPNAPVYCAAKAAVSMFGQGLALQLMQQDVRVTAFKPGPVNTQGFWGDRPVPREKFMDAADVAGVIEFVFSLPGHILMHEVSFESFAFFKK